MVTLAITSDAISLRALSDIADTLLAQRLSELTGIDGVTVQRNAETAALDAGHRRSLIATLDHVVCGRRSPRPARAQRSRSAYAAGHTAKAGTNISGAGGLDPSDACSLIVL